MKLLIASALLLILSIVTVDGSAVYDITGEPLKSGTYYHITSSIRGAGGGGLDLVLRKTLCPRHIWGCSLNVAQHSSDLNLGVPATFHPFNSGDKIVQVGSDVKIEFNYTIRANEPATWQLECDEGSTGLRYVTVGGEPIPDNVKIKWFKIEKAGGLGYILSYCPSVSGSDCPSVSGSDDTCGALGINFDGGRWLSLEDNSRVFSVVFIKAKPSGAISLATE